MVPTLPAGYGRDISRALCTFRHRPSRVSRGSSKIIVSSGVAPYEPRDLRRSLNSDFGKGRWRAGRVPRKPGARRGPGATKPLGYAREAHGRVVEWQTRWTQNPNWVVHGLSFDDKHAAQVGCAVQLDTSRDP